jgi:flagellar hook-associated protein 3 FlgL
MRVTSAMVVRSTLRDLSQSLGRLEHTQARRSSGRQLIAASDDPTAASDAMGLRRLLRRNEHYARSSLDARGWLDAADVSLTSGMDRLLRVKEIAVRAANSGGLSDPLARNAMAMEVSAVRAEMIALANTRVGDRSLFGGTAAGAAYSAAGVYLGDAGDVVRDVAPETSLTVNLHGPEIFGVAGGPVGSLFEVLDRMAAAIVAGDDAALAVEHANFDVAVERMSSATVEVGAKANRLSEIVDRAGDEEGRLRALLTEVEDVDVVEALVTAKAQENAYQAALQTAAKIIPPSLLDFLR